MIEHATGGPNQRCATNCPHPRAFTRHHDHRTNLHVLIVYILDRMCVRTAWHCSHRLLFGPLPAGAGGVPLAVGQARGYQGCGTADGPLERDEANGTPSIDFGLHVMMPPSICTIALTNRCAGRDAVPASGREPFICRGCGAGPEAGGQRQNRQRPHQHGSHRRAARARRA